VLARSVKQSSLLDRSPQLIIKTVEKGPKIIGLSDGEIPGLRRKNYMGILRNKASASHTAHDVVGIPTRHVDLAAVELRHSIYPILKRVGKNDVSAATSAAGGVRGSSQLFETSGGPLSNVSKPLLADLSVGYVVSDGLRTEPVQQRHLHEWSVSEFQLHQLATENLKRLTATKLQPQALNNALMLVIDGVMDSSAFLDDAVWDQLSLQYKGDLLVAVPSRDVLLVSAANDTIGTAQMMQLARQVYGRNEHRLSEFLYRRMTGTWVSTISVL
jgi:Protein of unknown function (DUF1444)